MREIVTKVKQNVVDELAKDKHCFGRVIKGIDLGRLSETEYNERIAGLPQFTFQI